MNYGLIVIFDEDICYADCLAEYFRTKGCLASELVVFTKKESFLDFTEKYPIDILIINEVFLELLNSISSNNIFILCENRLSVPNTANAHSLYKYSSAEELLRQVMSEYTPKASGPCISFKGKGDGKLIGISSPVGRCGKTSFALSLGLKLSLKHSCLFISFDELSSMYFILGQNTAGKKNLADLLYYFLQSPRLMDSKLISTITSFQNLDCISPAVSPGIYNEIALEDWISFISSLKGLKRYEYIILDFGTLQPVSHLLKMCQYIFVPGIKDDSYSDKKLSLFMDILESDLSVHKILLPSVNFSSIGTDYLTSLTSGELGLFTSTIISEFNL